MVQNGILTATGTAFVAQSGTVSAVLAGTQALVKSGTGSLTLSGVNSYTGGTTVSAGSLLLFGGDNRLSILGDITTSGGVLDLGGNSQITIGTITFGGGVVQNGTLMGTGSTYVVQSGTVSAEIIGQQGVFKVGTGTASLSGVNTYVGGTTIFDGTLQLVGGDDRLSTSGSIKTNGGVLDLGGNSQSTSGAITFAGGVVQNGTLSASGTAFAAQSGTVSAVLSGVLGLVKSGAGAVTLSGVNAYTGGTRVDSGSLVLSGGDDRLSLSGSITTTGGVLELGGNRQSTSGAITFAGGVVQNGTLSASGTAFAA
ncbi:MAG: hypothetical protein EBR81_14240, partial [Proteobacteria bacterium]|nr:hypothetical protein [Pseudomonadota bacterium]